MLEVACLELLRPALRRRRLRCLLRRCHLRMRVTAIVPPTGCAVTSHKLISAQETYR